MNLEEISQQNQTLAWEIIKETNIINIWESIEAKVNLVGSLKTGLMMKNKDIDFHIYTEKLRIAESFAAMEKLAENPGIKQIQYINGIETEEECIEWHVLYKDKQNNTWKMDLIHILKGSKYDGTVEKVTEAIHNVLTPATRKTILQIKFDVPDELKIPSLQIYRAVLSNGIGNCKDFLEWYKENPTTGLDWLP